MPRQSGSRQLSIAFIGGRGVVGTYSGIETYYEEVGSRLAAKGHTVTAYCRSYFTPRLESYRGIRIRRLPAVRTKHLETLSHSTLATVLALFHSHDIIQFHAIGSAPLALVPRLFGAKTVVSVRGLDWQRAKWGGFARRALQIGEWASARCPSRTVVVSQTLKSHYEQVHRIRPVVVPNAVMLEEPVAPERIKAYGLAEHSFFLFAGRISPEKGVDTLLEALRPLKTDKRLVLAGGSSYSDRYIDEMRALAWDGVLFLGHVDRAMMRELLSNCCAFVLPSWMEGLSIALLEALSFGACIITTDIPENREVVGAAGLTFPPGEVEALRSLLLQVLSDPALTQSLRAKAAARARDLPDWDGVAALTEKFYLELVS